MYDYISCIIIGYIIGLCIGMFYTMNELSNRFYKYKPYDKEINMLKSSIEMYHKELMFIKQKVIRDRYHN